MGQTRWRDVKDIFNSALERDGGERQAFLEEACRGDSDLRAEVESLLAADGAESMPWLDSPVFEAAAETLSRGPAEVASGRSVGPYRIVRRLGQGGMGTVYLAERSDDEYKSRVAVKLVRQDLGAEDMVRRFRQERQILASLDHPHIAKLLDGSVTEEGLPYFIMEYIEGEPIDVYCDRNALPLKARLELFRKVCSAVHHAHRHLVVHCDLKPSNILVTSDGFPKLLDFGIARLLGPDFVPRAGTVTLADSRHLTPEYASPEQVRGELLTTASDVYSLGVLLYRLLAGRLPFHFERRVMWEIERVICEEEPTRPSAVVERKAGSPRDEWHASTGRLRRLLAGDLDNIVLMAMRKAPLRRYSSVEQLAEDLRRHQVGLPVLARKDTLPYRVGKFVARHRVWVAAAVLVAMSLLGGIVTTAHMAFVANRERARAELVSDFMEKLFQEPDIKKEVPEDYTLEAVLDRGARRIRQELADQPEVQARLMNTLGVTYQHLGTYEASEDLLQAALDTRRRVFGPQSPEYTETLSNLCSLNRERSDYGKALPLCHETLSLSRSQAAPKELVQSLNRLALLERNMGDYEAAEGQYREALELGMQHLGKTDVRVAVTLHNLGDLLLAKSEYEKAEDHLRRAISIYRERLGDEHVYIAGGLNTLATVFKEQGKLQAAEDTYREAVEIQREVDPEHPDLGSMLNNLGLFLFYSRKDPAAAEPLFLEALELLDKLGEDERREVVIILNHLGAARRSADDLQGAEDYYLQALDLGRRRLGADDHSVTVSLLGLGGVLRVLDRAEEAEGHLREALAIREKAYPEGHRHIASAKTHLGVCLTALERYAEAERYLLDAYRVLSEQRGPGHRLTQRALQRVIELYDAWQRPAEAQAYRALVSD